MTIFKKLRKRRRKVESTQFGLMWRAYLSSIGMRSAVVNRLGLANAWGFYSRRDELLLVITNLPRLVKLVDVVLYTDALELTGAAKSLIALDTATAELSQFCAR